MIQPPNFIFLGLSGSGKGTQEELLQTYLQPHYKMRIISTGKKFRELQDLPTAAGHRIKETLAVGDLLPEQIAITLWLSDVMYTIEEDEGIIFDGSPRKIREAEQMDEFLKFLGRFDETKVVYLSVSPEEVTRRLGGRKRGDDTEEGIKRRIQFFYDEVMQTIEHYTSLGKLVEVSGENDPDTVHQNILKALKL